MVACLAGCRSEPVPVGSYEWVDPAAETAPLPVFPGATLLPQQIDLVRRARALRQPKGIAAPRLLLFDTDAPLEAVAKHFASLYRSPDGSPAAVLYGSGERAGDDAALAPLLGKLGVRYTPRASGGSYRWAKISGDRERPSITLEQPWRDFVGDRVVDRTVIMISE